MRQHILFSPFLDRASDPEVPVHEEDRDPLQYMMSFIREIEYHKAGIIQFVFIYETTLYVLCRPFGSKLPILCQIKPLSEVIVRTAFSKDRLSDYPNGSVI